MQSRINNNINEQITSSGCRDGMALYMLIQIITSCSFWDGHKALHLSEHSCCKSIAFCLENKKINEFLLKGLSEQETSAEICFSCCFLKTI